MPTSEFVDDAVPIIKVPVGLIDTLPVGLIDTLPVGLIVAPAVTDNVLNLPVAAVVAPIQRVIARPCLK